MEKVIHARVYAIVVVLLLVLGIGFLCYRVLSPFLAAIAWAIVLAVAFQRPRSTLERRLPGHRSLAAAPLTVWEPAADRMRSFYLVSGDVSR